MSSYNNGPPILTIMFENAILRQFLLVAGDSNGAKFYLCNSSIVMLKTKKQVFVAVLALMIHLFVLVLQRYEDLHHM